MLGRTIDMCDNVVHAGEIKSGILLDDTKSQAECDKLRSQKKYNDLKAKLATTDTSESQDA